MEPVAASKTVLADKAGRLSASRQPVAEPSSENHLQLLQRSMGNRALGMLLQTKLKVGPAGDEYEREADDVAERVMRMPVDEIMPGDRNELRRTPRESEEDEEVQGHAQVEPAFKQSEQEHPQETLARKGLTGASPQAGVSAPPIVHEVLRSPGQPLGDASRAFFEPRFGRDFGAVRVHTDARAAESAAAVNAHAYTVESNLVFGNAQYSPHSVHGRRLLAHELTHVVQQSASLEIGRADSDWHSPRPNPLRRSEPRVSRDDIIAVDLIVTRDEYTPPGTKVTFRVGDNAASRVLMDIEERGTTVVFRTFNFETGVATEMSAQTWDFYRGAAIIGGGNAGVARLGRSLKPEEWRALWPNPLPELLRRYESGKLALDDQAVLTGYHGMIRVEASLSLERNEHSLDELLGAQDRTQRIQEFTTGLREASLVRDALIQRKDELSRRLVAQHSFTFGLPHAGTGPDPVQQLRITQERGEVEQTLAFWMSCFPLLSRFGTDQINNGQVLAKLQEIKSNIVATRQRLDQGRLDPMTLDTVREHIAGKIGLRATAVVQAEDRSRSRWGIVKAVALTAGSIALLFLPFGVFLDAAIGVAMAAEAVADAQVLGQAANTGMHVDDGLVSQSQAQAAQFAATLAVVFAVVGAASAGFKVLRVGLALRRVDQLLPELAQAERGLMARAIIQGKLILAPGRVLSAGETKVAGILIREGRTVQTLGESVVQGVRTADFVVDGVRTELKTISNITSKDLSGALNRRILEGAGQASHIIADVQEQAGMTFEEAERAMRRTYGADKAKRIQQIRIIGRGFDKTWPRLP